jgi:uncharacterized Zn finger protein
MEAMDDAWDLATTRPSGAVGAAARWPELHTRRAITHPDEALVVYQDLIRHILGYADRHNYATATSLLKEMRLVAKTNGKLGDFDIFMDELAQENRRRPTPMEMFRKAGLPRHP